MEDKQLSRLKWRCRRGTRELDIMLTRFLDVKYQSLTELQIREFNRLLTLQDPELTQWLVEQQQPADKGLSDIVHLIHKANNL